MMADDHETPPVAAVMPLNGNQPLNICWCDGRGAAGERLTPNADKVYDNFCICDVGQAMK